MSNTIIELTDIEVVEELKVVAQALRDTLENLLEDSEDENEEKEIISASLEEITNIFTVLSWDKAVEYTKQAASLVGQLSAFGEGEAEGFLLRYCLILEQSIDSFDSLGLIVESDILGGSDIEDSQRSGGINTTLVKVLRTLYQKQLLALIRNHDKEAALNAISAISRDISAILPMVYGKDWTLLSFYIQAVLKGERVVDVETHRILAQLDARLSALLARGEVEPVVSPELIDTVRVLSNGNEFVEKNILIRDVYSISPAVYKNFGIALKDELVKIHEQLERVYLDQAQRLRLEEYFPFFEKLINVLKFMGLHRLSLLVHDLLISFKSLVAKAMDEEDFNHVVSKFWVLESFLGDLWHRRGQSVPLSYNENKDWAYINAKSNALKLFSVQYKKLREQLNNANDQEEIKALQLKLYEVVKVESVLSIVHDLTRYFTEDFKVNVLSKEELLEVILAIEYISNMNLENRKIAKDIIQNAKNVLRQTMIAEVAAVDESDHFGQDVVEALRDDLTGLESAFNAVIHGPSIGEEQYQTLIRIAHTLRGNANIVKLHDTCQLAASLENNMKANSNYGDDQILVYQKTLANIIEQFKEFLQQHS